MTAVPASLPAANAIAARPANATARIHSSGRRHDGSPFTLNGRSFDIIARIDMTVPAAKLPGLVHQHDDDGASDARLRRGDEHPEPQR